MNKMLITVNLKLLLKYVTFYFETFLILLKLVSSIHAIMATTAGVIVVSACSGNVMTDR